MTPTLFRPAVLIAVLLLTVSGNTQNNTPDTLLVEKDTVGYPVLDTTRKQPAPNNLVVLSRKDSLKLKKKARKMTDPNDTINPYQPNNTVVKPLPYNSHKEKDKPVERPILPVGEILRDIIVPKKN